MTSEEKMRGDFEAWCVKEVELPEGYELNWNNDSVRLMYRGWKASRESLVIELPGGRYDLCAMTNEIRGWNRAYDACVESIHAAGVKTK